MPWEEVQITGTFTGRVNRVDILAVQYADTCRRKRFHAPLPCRMLGLRRVNCGDSDEGDALADGLGDQPQSESVGDTGGPLVDGVEGCGRDDDGVRWWESIRLLRHLVFAANRMAGQLGQLVRIDEVAGRWGEDAADGPAGVPCEFHQDVEITDRTCGAANEIEHTTGRRGVRYVRHRT